MYLKALNYFPLWTKHATNNCSGHHISVHHKLTTALSFIPSPVISMVRKIIEQTLGWVGVAEITLYDISSKHVQRNNLRTKQLSQFTPFCYSLSTKKNPTQIFPRSR